MAGSSGLSLLRAMQGYVCSGFNRADSRVFFANVEGYYWLRVVSFDGLSVTGVANSFPVQAAYSAAGNCDAMSC